LQVGTFRIALSICKSVDKPLRCKFILPFGEEWLEEKIN
jgi:hypothetical protein